eukprot:CFRG2916T1
MMQTFFNAVLLLVSVSGIASSTDTSSLRCCAMTGTVSRTQCCARLDNGTDFVYDVVADTDGTCESSDQSRSYLNSDLLVCSTEYVLIDKLNGADPDNLPWNQVAGTDGRDYEYTLDNYFCDVTCDFTTSGYWDFVASGAALVLTSSVTWSDTTELTDVSDITQALTAGAKVTFGVKDVWSVELSSTYTYTTEQTITNMYSSTSGGSYTIQSTIDCTDRIYQYHITQEGTTGAGTSVDIQTLYFACIPLASSGSPVCPPEACGNAACDCCNNDDWASDGSIVTLCSTSELLTSESSQLLTATIL